MTKEILMIEDDNFLRETFEKQLSLNSEYKFIGFYSAEKAFDYLENSTKYNNTRLVLPNNKWI